MTEKNSLEKIKDASSGIAGGASMVAGIFTGNPLLTIGGATSLFGSIISPTINGWRNQWFEDLLIDFRKLEHKVDGFNFEEKLKDPKIISIILEATLTAIKTGEQEKHKILRNAVLNMSLVTDVKDDEQHLVLNTLSQLSPTHIVILQDLLNRDNQRKERHHYCEPSHDFLNKHTLLSSYMTFLTNLENLGLMTIERSQTRSYGDTVIHPSKVSSFGEIILEYIKNPIQE